MPEHDDELSALRERAYGPGADIDSDASAMDRLRELEDRSRAVPRLTVDEELHWDGEKKHQDAASADAAPDDFSATAEEQGPVTAFGVAEGAASVDLNRGTGAPETLAASAATGTADPDGASAGTAPAPTVDTEEPPRRPWWTRRVPLLWVGSVVVALVIGALSASGISGLVAGRVAVLQPDEDAEWPTIYAGDRRDDGVVFDEFHELLVLAIPQSLSGGQNDDSEVHCLYVIPRDAPGSAGLVTAGCAAAPFPAVASFAVEETSSAAVRDAYPVGTSLRFTLEGAQVLVDARRP